MKRMLRLLALAAGAHFVLTGVASAQGYGVPRTARHFTPSQRPMVSPYLNLLQFEEANDQSLPVYQTLVRPFVDQRRLNQVQAREVFQLQQQVARSASQAAQGAGVRETGHITTFGNMSHFYPSMQRR